MAITDASAVMGAQVEGLEDVTRLASGEYNENVREAMPRDYVQMYHPDGTTSIVQLPPLGKGGKGMKDRQQKIMHYIVNKRHDGVQWWYPSPPTGWEPAPLPYRCPVSGCSRRGGLPDLLNLWRHINQKHPGEVELYSGVMNAIKKKLDEEVPADLQALLESGPVVKDETNIAPQGTTCPQCGKGPPEDHGNPVGWLNGHLMGAHKEGN